MVCTRKNW